MYQYSAQVKRIIDGDSLQLTLDLGLSIFTDITARVYGINTPETNSSVAEERARAQAAKQFLVALLGAQTAPLAVVTHKDAKEKYGRYLIEIIISKDENGKPFEGGVKTVAEYMIARGYGVAYFGGAR
jgi:micrococcal nuclease